MKVYVLLEEISWNYEGSQTEVLGVFANKAAAIRAVRKEIPDADRSRVRWEHPAKQGDDHVWFLEHLKVES